MSTRIASCYHIVNLFTEVGYVRYADDTLFGFAGPRSEAEEIKEQLGHFLQETLKLEMSQEKTLITHASTEKARFLNYHIVNQQCDTKHTRETAYRQRSHWTARPSRCRGKQMHPLSASGKTSSSPPTAGK